MGQKPFEHYYTQSPTSELLVKETVFTLRNGHSYPFKTPSGVFSFGHVDRATRILIEYFHFHPGTLLDLGCGYGVIGITLKKEFPSLTVFMSDINERAIRFSKVNTKNHNLEIEIRQGPLLDPWEGLKFDTIVTNPPIAAGKSVWTEIVEKSIHFLNPQGSLQVVAFHHKGGERIMNRMAETFGNVATTVKSGGIRIYESFLKENEKK